MHISQIPYDKCCKRSPQKVIVKKILLVFLGKTQIPFASICFSSHHSPIGNPINCLLLARLLMQGCLRHPARWQENGTKRKHSRSCHFHDSLLLHFSPRTSRVQKVHKKATMNPTQAMSKAFSYPGTMI